jgi:hypothetical protein
MFPFLCLENRNDPGRLPFEKSNTVVTFAAPIVERMPSASSEAMQTTAISSPPWRRLALDAQRRTIWIADAHRDDEKRFIVHADEILTAFLELERAVCIHLLTEQI